MSISLGKLIPLDKLPEIPFLEALDSLVFSPEKRAKLAELTADPRLTSSAWHQLLHREILDLYHWAVSRMAFTIQSFIPSGSAPETVLSLLPRTALATHVLRRAIPFAALGIPTTCGFPETQRTEGERIVNVLASAMNLNTLHSEHKSCQEALTFNSEFDRLVIVTGRISTLKQIKMTAQCPVVGSTGHCAVLLGVDPVSTLELYRTLTKHPIENSCSRLRAVFICASLEETSLAGTIFKKKVPILYKINEILKQLHPSVVFTPKSQSGYNDNFPDYLCGYRVIPCSLDSSSTSGIGFGADPVYGWPGDYLI